MSAASPLVITATDEGLALVGEVDAHTAPALAEAIDASERSPLVIDMSDVGFLDSSGLRVLIEAHRSADADGRTVQLSQPSPAVSRLLEISGIDDYLNVVD